MLNDFDIENMKERYKLYGSYWLNIISKKGLKIGEEIELKVEHGISMSNSVEFLTLNSGLFNETYAKSGAIDGLLHDIGRFPEYYLCGSLKDTYFEKITGFRDHGQYGAYILEKNNRRLLRWFIGDNTSYDKIIIEIVKEHTTTTNKKYLINIEKLIDTFQKYDLDYVLKCSNDDLINKLIALKLLILKEQDSLEILYKVGNGLWKPKISSEKRKYIKDEVWNIFIEFGYIDMKELKEKGLWSCNAGFLLRYSLIFHNVNFVCTLKKILDEKIIEKMYYRQIKNVRNKFNQLETDYSLIDKRIKDAYLFTLDAVKNLIETSPDGKIITDKSRKDAGTITLSKFKNI